MNSLYYSFIGLFFLLVSPQGEQPGITELTAPPLGGWEVNEEQTVQTTADFCGHSHAQQLLFEQQPAIAEQSQRLEEDAYRFLANYNPNDIRALETLPVVFHIIHSNGPENISDAIALQGLADLNAAFANQGYYDQGTGVNTDLQFCLAKRDPNGNATTGINRVNSALTNMTLETQDLAVKDLIRWDPVNYVNIWLVAEICSDFQGCDIAGYALFPSAHGSPEDGIVLEAQWLGSNSGNTTLLTHEMGHYLGLFHTFENGCTNSDCLADGDHVCDTPPDQSTLATLCDNAPNTCSTDVNAADPNNPLTSDVADMIINYMDYGDWNCYSAFTQGQTDRMHFFVEGVRSSLLDSDACLELCSNPVTANFSSSSTNIIVDETLNFINNSTNANQAAWFIDNQPFSMFTDASLTFNTVGTFVISLEVGNNDPNCSDEFSMTIEVSCPVASAFNPSTPVIEVGTNMVFLNSSNNAQSYEWTVDGNSLSTDFNYNTSFTQTGIIEVCLIASNAFCADTSCFSLTVVEATEECNATFIKSYGLNNFDEKAYVIAEGDNQNFYVGGSREDSVLIFNIDETGNLLWERSFLFSGFGENILEGLIVDSNGFLVGVGMGYNSANERQGFVFRYDPNTDALIWVQLHSAFVASVNNIALSEISAGGDFLVAGQSRNNIAPGFGCDGYLFQIGRNTGTLTGLNQSYNLGACETFNAAQIYNGNIYLSGQQILPGGGNTKVRPSLSRFDLNGNEIWSRLYLAGPTENARLYQTDLLIENDFIIQAHHGDKDGDQANNPEVFLSKTNLDGELGWAKEYTLSANNNDITFLEITSTADGYALLGMDTDTDKIFILKTDKDGNPLWAKTYGGAFEMVASYKDPDGNYAGIEMIYANNYFYIAAYSQGAGTGDDDIYILKLDGNGLVNSSCAYIENIELSATDFPNPYDGLHPLIAYNSGIFAANPTIINPINTNLTEEIICIAGCIEICDNGIDDDQDGLIDCYDPDCCNTPGCDAFYYTGCPEGCVFTFDDAPISAEIEWESSGPGDWCSYNTPITGDIDGDGVPEVIGKPCTGDSIPALGAYPNLLIVDGATGNIEAIIITPAFYYLADGPAIADVDRNGYAEIFIMASDHPDNNNYVGSGPFINGNVARRVLCYEYNGSTYVEKWMSEAQAGYNDIQQAVSVSVADFNGDGIPELYLGTQIFNSLTGELIVEGGINQHHGNKPVGDNASQSQSLTVAADVLPDSECANCTGLEIVAGGMVFSVNINTTNPAASMMSVEKTLPGSTDKDGFTSLADIDKDGDLDAVVTTTNSNFGIIYAWDLQTNTLLYSEFQTPSSTDEGFISQANIADFDGDGFPEIGVCTKEQYRVIKPTGNPSGGTLDVVWTLNTDDNSGSTGSAVFDFNNDGAQEVVYRGETQLRILDGSTGITLTGIPCASGTRIEYPVIVDVDNDGETEILCSCENTLTAYGSAFIPWLNARSVWNQHNYMNININDDLTVPAVQQESHIVGDSVELNNFLTMYADQDYLVADATITLDTSFCDAIFNTVVIFEICNIGANGLNAETPIAFYQNNPTTNTSATLDSVSTLGQTLQSGDCLTFSLIIPNTINNPIFVIINDDGSENPPFDLEQDFPVNFIPECDYTNNMVGTEDMIPFIPLDLGPDLEICENGIIVLDAGPGFESYLWNNLSFQQSISVSNSGTYYVRTLIGCTEQTDSINITVDPTSILSLGPDVNVCTGETVTITVQEDNFDQYTWQSSAPLSCDDCPSATLNPTDDETEVIVTGITNNGCLSSDTILIIAGFAFLEDSIYLCFGEQIIINGIVISGNGLYYDTLFNMNDCDSILSITSFESTELFLNIESTTTCPEDEDGTTTATVNGGLAPFQYDWAPELTNSPNQFAIGAGNYTLTVTDANGCTATSSVNVDAKPGVDFLYETIETTCYDSSDGALLIDSTTMHLQFNLENLFFTSNLVFDGQPCGPQILYVLDTLNCIHTEPFFIPCPPEIVVLLPADTTIALGEMIDITSATNIQDSVIYEWMPPNFLDCTDCLDVTSFPLETIDYTLMVTDTAGCTDIDTMRVIVTKERRVYIPNAFSPNGDGINDILYIFSDFGVAEVLDFKIFDRWGELQFSDQNFPTNDRTHGWDGYFKGKPMSSGVFAYFAKIRFVDGKELLYSGDISIIK
ncbi:MAG: gliding motility-associated-like protein [Gammaproteobacteria bacterium]|jgi:gliding motility-associated-like protein